MIYEKIELNKHFDKLKSNALLTALCPENCPEIELERLRKCLLILPGGGYNYTSKRESDPIAFKFIAEDIACFILNYVLEWLPSFLSVWINDFLPSCRCGLSWTPRRYCSQAYLQLLASPS